MVNRKDNDRKSRSNEDFDFLVQQEMRKHRRVGSGAFAGIPVVLKPAPPFFGEEMEGKMVDLSGGGLAVLMKEAVPVKTKLKLWMVLAGREAITCTVSVRRVSSKEDAYLTGLQFLDLSEDVAADLAKLSGDFDACETRIRQDETPVCVPGCSFYALCDKPQKQTK